MPASVPPSPLPDPVRPYRVLSLDGGGAKGFYTLGALQEMEARVGRRLGDHFDFIYGTSTGAMVAALLGLGRSIDEIMAFYRRNVPPLIHERTPWAKSALLKHVVDSAFGTLDFSAFRTRVGIVSTHWSAERPLLLRGSTPPSAGPALELHALCTIAQAVEASCSAYPFFDRLELGTIDDGTIELADGSYSANNPVLFALGDALAAAHGDRQALRLISVGVGIYPRPSYHGLHGWLHGLKSARLIQKMLNVNTETMEQLRQFLYGDVPALRINRVFSEPDMAIDLMESNLPKLETLSQRGRESVIAQQPAVDELLLDSHPASPASVPCP